MPDTKYVALLVETSGAYTRGLLRGVVRYARERGDWRLALADHHPRGGPPAWFADWRGDGVIARIDSPGMAAAIRATGLPAVDMSDARLLSHPPFVKTDDGLVGQLAAAHFRERGLFHFGYCGDARSNWSAARGERFRAELEAAGHPCRVHCYAEWDRTAEAGLAAWIAALPKPAGVFAANDLRGREVLAAAKLAGVGVPDDLAVLGVDNDELLCDLADPPLSSVVPDTTRIGQVAAGLLDALMTGGYVASEGHLVAPLGIVARESSERLGLGDPEVAAAVRFIRRRACEGANVADVLQAVAVSRRVLEVRFTRELGRTPHEEIMRVRMERAKSLLTGTELPLEAVAHRSGFRDAAYLSRVFRRELGMTPAQCRAGRGGV